MNRTFLAAVLVATVQGVNAGTFTFATGQGEPELLVHPMGYSGTGGNVPVEVCIDPTSAQTGDLVVPVQNAIDRYNQWVPTIGNVVLPPSSGLTGSTNLDFESVLLHEMGHCLGLGHPNMASESGLSGAQQEFTKSTAGLDMALDLGAGTDGVNGSPDDQRDDDVNFHWFEVGVNDPFRLPLRSDIDPGSYSVELSDLPIGDSFAANADRTVSTSVFGLPMTEAILQQGSFSGELQHGLGADDIATLQIARAGVDRIAGTADDYSVTLTYGGIKDSCDLNVSIDDAETGFAVCKLSAVGIATNQFRLTRSDAFFATRSDWHFATVRVPAPVADGLAVATGGTQTVLNTAQASLLANDTHPASATLVVDASGTFGGPLNGTVSLNANGTFSYTHDGGGSTSDFFVYRVCVSGTQMCAYQYANVTVSGAVGESVLVTATPSPDNVDEPGGDVTIAVQVMNDSGIAGDVTITTLTDNVAGSLDGVGTCDVPQVIDQGASYWCTYTASLASNGNGSESRTVTASGTHDNAESVEDDDNAIVAVNDVPPSGTVGNVAAPDSIDEPGGNVTWTVTVTSTNSAESLDLIALTDDLNGNLDGQGTCSVPQTIAASGSYQCSYSRLISGAGPGDRVNTTTATLEDDEGGLAMPSGAETVTINDVPPTGTVTNAAAPSSISEPGDSVTWTVTVANTNSVESLDLTALVDDLNGNLDGQGTCTVPQVIGTGTSYQCSYTVLLESQAPGERVNTTTATLADDDGGEATPSGEATVTVTDVLPTASATYDAAPANPEAPQATIQYTIGVTNTGTAESLTLDALADDVLGDLDGRGTCDVPATIAAGASYGCSFSVTVDGEEDETVTRTLTATLSDDEANDVQPTDDASVVFQAAGNDNTAPVANDDDLATDEDTSLVIAPPGVLGNDTDEDDDDLTVFDATGASSGSVNVTADGGLEFDPADDFAGEVTLSYRATDGQAVSNSATVTITVRPVNDPPVAVDDTFDDNGDAPVVVAAPGVLANDSDVDDETLTARVGTPPEHGELELALDGGFTYTPGPTFGGGDSYTYLVSDGDVEREATVAIGEVDLVFASSFEAGEGQAVGR